MVQHYVAIYWNQNMYQLCGYIFTWITRVKLHFFSAVLSIKALISDFHQNK